MIKKILLLALLATFSNTAFAEEDIYAEVDIYDEVSTSIEDQNTMHYVLHDAKRLDQSLALAQSMNREFKNSKSDVCFSVLGPINAMVDVLSDDVDELSESFKNRHSGLTAQLTKARKIADSLIAYCLPMAVFEKEFSIKKAIDPVAAMNAVKELKAVNTEFTSNLNQLLN